MSINWQTIKTYEALAETEWDEDEVQRIVEISLAAGETEEESTRALAIQLSNVIRSMGDLWAGDILHACSGDELLEDILDHFLEAVDLDQVAYAIAKELLPKALGKVNDQYPHRGK